MTKCAFVDPAAKFTVGGNGAAAGLELLKPNMLAQQVALDERVNAGWPDYEAALQATGTRYEAFIYPDVNQGFHNDSTPRHDEAAAALAWERTLAHFAAHLS